MSFPCSVNQHQSARMADLRWHAVYVAPTALSLQRTSPACAFLYVINRGHACKAMTPSTAVQHSMAGACDDLCSNSLICLCLL